MPLPNESHWIPRQFVRLVGEGRTKPLVLRCAPAKDPSAPASLDVVAKLLGCPEVTEQSLFCELFGTLLAHRLGVNTSTPRVLQLEAEFAAYLNAHPDLIAAGIVTREGPGFGVDFVRGAQLTSQLVPTSDIERSDAASILAFDVVFQNHDRMSTRPNLARAAGRLLAFDFEMAFGFVYAVGPQPAPHEVSKLVGFRRHSLYEAVRGHPALVEAFIEKLAGLTDEELEALADEAPRTWQLHRVAILAHVRAARDKAKDLRTEMKGLLQ